MIILTRFCGACLCSDFRLFLKNSFYTSFLSFVYFPCTGRHKFISPRRPILKLRAVFSFGRTEYPVPCFSVIVWNRHRRLFILHIHSRIFGNVIAKLIFCVQQFFSAKSKVEYLKNQGKKTKSARTIFSLLLLSFSFATVILELFAGLRKPAFGLTP